MKDEQKPKTYQRKIEGELTLSGSTMVITSAPLKGEPQILGYEASTPSFEIAQDAIKTMHLQLQPVYIETVTETIERSKGLGRGVNLGIGFKDYGELKFEIKPTKEVKTIQKVIWRKPE